MKDYRVDIRVRNARILRAIQEKGFSSIPMFCKEYRICAQSVYEFIRFKTTPKNKYNRWRNSLVKLAKALGCAEQELFPDRFLNKTLSRNSVSIDVDNPCLLPNKMLELNPYEIMESEEKREVLIRSVDELDQNEKKVIQLRYNLEDDKYYTYSDIGKKIKRSCERVRQIQIAALQKLRRTYNSKISA